jgi:hypothetical protein
MWSNQLSEKKNPGSEPDGRLLTWNVDSKTDFHRIPPSEIEIPFQDPPPDGGFIAWIQVFAGWLLVLNTRYL